MLNMYYPLYLIKRGHLFVGGLCNLMPGGGKPPLVKIYFDEEIKVF